MRAGRYQRSSPAISAPLSYEKESTRSTGGHGHVLAAKSWRFIVGMWSRRDAMGNALLGYVPIARGRLSLGTKLTLVQNVPDSSPWNRCNEVEEKNRGRMGLWW